MKYILSNGIEVESIPIGRSPMKIGENFNGVTILDRAPNKADRKAYAICKCKCGNIFITAYSNLKNGHTKSCGCYNKEIHAELCKELGKQTYSKDYTKKENPYYIFKEQLVEKDNNNSFYWLIECKQCHALYKAVPSQLISGTRRKGSNPCPCWNKISKGVIKIQDLLKENNISFTTEQKFDSCISPKGNPMKFDFYVNNKYLIEFDGEQHFIPQTFGGNEDGELRLKKQQEYDNIKNQWCIDNNITLIRIPYTIYNNLKIEDLLEETSKYKIKE